MKPMRLLSLLLWSGALACAGDLSTAKTVYVLSMYRGMDQYLANRLTNDHLLQVVTDPKKADIIITDHIGDAFEQQLDTIFPPPEPAKPETKTEPKPAEDAGNSLFGPAMNKLSNPATSSSFGRSKGTVFLVDAKSREILWSVYAPPKSSTGKDLDRTANDIVSRFKKDLTKK